LYLLIDSQDLLILFFYVHQTVICEVDGLLDPFLYSVQSILRLGLSVESVFDDLVVVHPSLPPLSLVVFLFDPLFEPQQSDLVPADRQFHPFCVPLISGYPVLILGVPLPVAVLNFFLRAFGDVQKLLLVEDEVFPGRPERFLDL